MPIDTPSCTSRSIDAHRLVQRRIDAVGDHHGVLGMVQSLAQHHELVATEAGHRVAGAHDRTDPVGDGDQDLVAQLVTHRVVDRLEVVQVDEQQRDRVPAAEAAQSVQRTLDPLEQQRPVGQAGERVVSGLLRQRRLQQLLVADVARPRRRRTRSDRPARSRCASSCTSIGTARPSWRIASISPDQRTKSSGSSMMSAITRSMASLAGSQLRPTHRSRGLVVEVVEALGRRVQVQQPPRRRRAGSPGRRSGRRSRATSRSRDGPGRSLRRRRVASPVRAGSRWEPVDVVAS